MKERMLIACFGHDDFWRLERIKQECRLPSVAAALRLAVTRVDGLFCSVFCKYPDIVACWKQSSWQMDQWRRANGSTALQESSAAVNKARPCLRRSSVRLSETDLKSLDRVVEFFQLRKRAAAFRFAVLAFHEFLAGVVS